MSCENHASDGGGGDRLDGNPGDRPFDRSATAWLIGQGVRALNTADKEGELAYQHVVEILRQRGTELMDTVVGLFRQANSGDAPLRWNLLHVLGDAGDPGAADFLVRTALNQLPEPNPDQCCEGSRDMEILVGTMAIHGLGRIAKRNPDSAEAILKIVSARPARPLLVEAVKVATELGLKEKVREILPKEEHWILDIRRARTEEVFAEPEREDGKERGFTPPRAGALNTAPKGPCCVTREN
jgi:hypothetical protein